MSVRIDQLLQFINEDPEDPFNHYALALEYCKTDDRRALQILEEVANKHPQYVPVYYQLAGLYARNGQTEKALQTFKAGVAIARNAGDHKTVRELNAGLEELLDDDAG
jgi:tetratricopeptide (TPR) repeat protein